MASSQESWEKIPREWRVDLECAVELMSPELSAKQPGCVSDLSRGLQQGLASWRVWAGKAVGRKGGSAREPQGSLDRLLCVPTEFG